MDKQVIAKSRSDYWDDLDTAIDADRVAHGKKPLKKQDREPIEKETKVSRTDPEAGYMVRDGKPKGFFYLDHRTVDGNLAIITDTHATPANVHDSIVYLDRFDRQRVRFGFDTQIVGLDAGYATSGIARGLEDRDIRGPSPDHMGQGHLQAAKGDHRAFLRRCKTTTRSPISPLPGPRCSHYTVPARRYRTKHQENSKCTDPKPADKFRIGADAPRSQIPIPSHKRKPRQK